MSMAKSTAGSPQLTTNLFFLRSIDQAGRRIPCVGGSLVFEHATRSNRSLVEVSLGQNIWVGLSQVLNVRVA